MKQLPAEMLRLIISALGNISHSQEGPPFPALAISATTDFKALRLVSRWLANIVPEFLYWNVVLYMTEESFAKIMATSKHPLYDGMVHYVTFYTRIVDDVFKHQADHESTGKAMELTRGDEL